MVAELVHALAERVDLALADHFDVRAVRLHAEDVAGVHADDGAVGARSRPSRWSSRGCNRPSRRSRASGR